MTKSSNSSVWNCYVNNMAFLSVADKYLDVFNFINAFCRCFIIGMLNLHAKFGMIKLLIRHKFLSGTKINSKRVELKLEEFCFSRCN